MLRSYLAIGVLVLVPSLAHAQALSSESCERLASLTLRNTVITTAEVNSSGSFVPPGTAAAPNANLANLPPFCRVAATLRPSSGSDIRIEVWMPVANWNNKFQGVGNGGFAGSITYTSGAGGIQRGMAEALKRGYATASTDTGHTATAGSAFLGDPEKLADFGYRAVHEMTVAAKAIIDAFYGTGPKLSYWNGCSTGGRQGLMEAQRYPADYDGIIAGAPANPQTRLAAWNVYIGQTALKNPANTIPASKYPMVHQAVVDACDALDGLRDGLIAEPNRCSFDFKTLECRGGDSASCLTAAQVETALKVTSPAVSKNGEAVFPGLALGTELGWATKIGGPEPSTLGTDYFKYAVFKDPSSDWRTFDFDSAVALADRIDGGTTDATSPDLTAFRQRGGKLLLYHGWRDQNFSAQSTINYYRSVLERMGSGSHAEWLRLFLVPGMGHCGGGEGPNAFDAVTALEQWVESGRPPAAIVASHRTDGKVDRTRPLCPYPQVARYTGTGSIDEAANFVCRMPDAK